MKIKKNQFRLFGIKKISQCAILFSACLLQAGAMFSQSTYDDFEGNKLVYYSAKTGTLDTLAENPGTNNINSKAKCAKYVRSSDQKFDNIKMNLSGKLADVTKYATYLGIPPVISMKLYTTAPVGTLIEIQLGKRGKTEYPVSINSQYQAHTTVSNAWEEVHFKFSQVPKGSLTSVTEIDQVSLLFDPNSSTKDTYYFKDVTGPPLISEKPKTVATPIKKTVAPVNKTKTASK